MPLHRQIFLALLVGILLAAGSSTRFGGFKLMQAALGLDFDGARQTWSESTENIDAPATGGYRQQKEL